MTDQKIEDFILIDDEKVKDLLSMDPSKDFFRKLVDIFDVEIKKAPLTLRTDFDNKNFSSMSRLSHRLRSTSLNLGAARLGEIFRRLEYLNYEQATSNEVNTLITCIEKEFDLALQKLHSYL